MIFPPIRATNNKLPTLQPLVHGRLVLVGALLHFLVCTVQEASASLVNLSGYANVYHVALGGSDSNDGSESNPFASVGRAVDAAASSGDAIFIQSGQYDVTDMLPQASFGPDTGLNNKGKDVDFIGVPNETVLYIDGATSSYRDIHFYSGKGFSRIYDMTFIRDSDNRSTNYSNSFFGFGPVKGEIYNSVFKTINSPTPSLTYSNTGTVSIAIYNSVFDLEANMASSYSGQGGLQIVNSVSTHAFSNDGNVYANNLTGVLFDEDYNIVAPVSGWQDAGQGFDPDGSAADLGVYGGDYTWAVVPEPSTITLAGAGVTALLLVARRRRGA